MRPPEQSTVVIAGGGPVGMLLAAELGLQRIDTVVIEPHPRTPDTPRAGTLHARTVQSLLRRGYLRLPEPGSLQQRQSTGFHFGGLPLLEISAPTAEGPPILGQSQEALERAFEARARSLGVDIRRGQRVVGVRSHPRHLEVEVRSEGGEVHRITADHLVGCDGARSTVREQSGIPGTTAPPTFDGLIGQVRLLDPMSVPPGWTHTPEGWTLINVNPRGQSRVLTHDFTRPLPDRRRPVSLDELQRTAERILGREIPMDRPTHLSRFSDFSRLADTYRSGRFLLAGDAAHVHAPLGGQGLNTGLQDALNLGWKLALVARGDSTPELLDTYTEERRPVAEAVIANTRAQANLMQPGPEHDPLRRFTTRLLQLPEVNRLIADEVSGQGVAYREKNPTSELEGRFLPNHRFRTPSGAPTVAELLGDAIPLFLLTPEADAALERAARGWADRVRTVRVSCAAPLDWTALVCRPDGYVAWAASGAQAAPDRLVEALRRWFGPSRELPWKEG